MSPAKVMRAVSLHKRLSRGSLHFREMSSGCLKARREKGLRGGVKSVGPRFQPAEVQWNNILRMILKRKAARYFEGSLRILLVVLNSWFVINIYVLALEDAWGVPLLDIVLKGSTHFNVLLFWRKQGRLHRRNERGWERGKEEGGREDKGERREKRWEKRKNVVVL